MKNPGIALAALSALLFTAAPVFSQSGNDQGHGKAVVTIVAKKDGAAVPAVTIQNLSLTVNGKQASVTSWTPLQGPADPLELVILIDSAARNSLGTQLGDITEFVKSLPPNTKAAIAYMENGRAVFAGPLTADHAQVLRALHIPGGPPGISASPYFCLSDLAKHWPSKDEAARREVVMVTDGVDYYEMRFDPEDPYVQAAISDALQAHLVVDSIYWLNRGWADRTEYENMAGQNLLSEVTEATGGESYWYGMGNPVTLKPYFDKIALRLRNQYELEFAGHLSGKPHIESMKLKLRVPGAEVDAPEQAMVFPNGSMMN